MPKRSNMVADHIKDYTEEIIAINKRISQLDEERDNLMHWKYLIQEEIYKLQDRELETCLMI